MSDVLPGSQGTVNLQDAPGGDFDLDSLFPNPEGNAPEPQAPPAPATPEPQAPAEPQVFLKAGNTVYKTPEDAATGIARKDALIEQLRQDAIARTGIDPVTKQKVQSVPTPSQGEVNYTQDGKTYFTELSSAFGPDNKIDYDKYTRTQQKLILDTLAPFLPVIQTASKTTAIATVESELKDFRQVRESKEFQETLDALPDIKASIEMAENDPRMAARLAAFYKIAYYTTKGRTAGQATQPVTQAAPAPVVPIRPTMAASSVAPPATPTVRPTAVSPSNAPLSERQAARRAYIEDAERRGIGDLPI